MEGKRWSGVAVGTITMSSSEPSTPAASRMRSEAANARSLAAWSGAAKRRSRMPVRLTIHSSLVSTRPAISSLVTTLSGA